MSEQGEEIIKEENSVTMLDVLREENQLEEDACAVLGASDDKNCTYSQVTRKILTLRASENRFIKPKRF